MVAPIIVYDYADYSKNGIVIMLLLVLHFLQNLITFAKK